MRNFTKVFFPFCLSLIFVGNGYAQKVNSWCGQTVLEQKFRNDHPEHLSEILEAENQLNSGLQNNRNTRSSKVVPVVFHIIHENGNENIIDQQIFDQMRILNEDYNGLNSDLSDVVQSFTSVIGNMDIEFRLARKDPNGNTTNGIDRIYSTQTNNGSDAAKLNPWPRSKYLNIWVVKSWNSTIPNGVLAYAYKPASVVNSPLVDGIICLSQYIGSIGTGSPLYARTLTHEIGHYLNLSHTWGNTNEPGVSSNCNTDDGVNDTPNCIGTFGCNLNATSCGSLDNIQNHMDYSNCTVMFTQGQKLVVNNALNSSISSRNNLTQTNNLIATGVYDLLSANFSANKLSVCEHDEIKFTDYSEYGPDSWSWDFPKGANGTSNQQNPTEHYSGYGLFNVTLSASKGNSTVSKTRVGYIHVNPILGHYAPYFEDFSKINSLNHEFWYSINQFEDNYGFNLNSNNGIDQSACLQLENFGNELPSKDEILTTTFDLRVFSSITLSFKAAYAQKSASDNSKLALYVTNDCGKTWLLRWSSTGGNIGNSTVSGTYYTPSSNNEWKLHTINTISGSLLSMNNQFKLVFENKNGNNLYIDDFNISGEYSNTAQLKYPLNGQEYLANTTSISWKAMGGGVDSYEYQLDSNPNFNSSNLQSGINAFISTNDGPDTRYTPTNLVNGKTYYWRVRLIKSGQPQNWSETWWFKVADNGVSIQEILSSEYQLKISPNPIKENGILEFNLQKPSKVTIYATNTLGITYILMDNIDLGKGSHVLNLSTQDWSKGFYTIGVNIEQKTMYKKLIVQ